VLFRSQYPPEKPTFEGPSESYLDAENTFTISSHDEENDRIRYYIDWGDGTTEWTDFHDSGEEVSLTHVWKEKGSFTIYFESEDEHGSSIYEFPMMDRTVISIIDEEVLDQKMTDRYQGQVCNWAFVVAPQELAQSFVPQHPVLTRMDLQLGFFPTMSTELLPVKVSIKENLTGVDIVQTSAIPQEGGKLYMPLLYKTPWLTFNFPDTELTPGKTYYIVVHYDLYGSTVAWDHSGKFYFDDPDYAGDTYPNGEGFISYDNGRSWELYPYAYDFCFVTFGS
jgi:hypothetical protein